MPARLMRNPLRPEAVETIEAVTFAEVAAFAFEGNWPVSAHAYSGPPSEETECTPLCLEDLARPLPDDCLVVVLPNGPIGKAFNVIFKPIIKLFSFLTPKTRTPDVNRRQNQNRGSPNNELGERVNSARLGERIAEVFGLVRMTPDLIAEPFRIFVGHSEVEVAYMCLGVGTYEIDAGDVRDGETPAEDIAGVKVEIYGPDTSPNSGSPQLTIGGAIGRTVEDVRRSNAINGQVLRAPNADQINGNNNIRFTAPDSIEADAGVDFDFTDFFAVGDSVIVTNAAIVGPPALDLAGTYEINTVTADTLALVNPALVNADWSSLVGSSAYISPTLKTATDKWTEPVVINHIGANKVIANIVAAGGVYGRDNSGNQYGFTVSAELRVTELDGAGLPTGSPQLYPGVVEGSAVLQSLRAVTIEASLPFAAPFQVEARRSSNADPTKDEQDEITLRDLYSVAPVSDLHFGDLTTALVQTVATRSAQALKERKFNVLGTRMLPTWDSGTQTFGALAATRDVAPIAVALALDPYNGRYPQSLVDVDSFYAASAACQAHFGSALASEVSITLDDPEQSFEDALEVIAGTAFCVPYRDGPILKLRFDGPETAAVMLLNHRSILPRSQTRAYRTGREDDFDGVTVSYTNPDDDTEETLSIPAEPTNAKEVTLEGVRLNEQAWWHAWREYGRITYQAVSTELTATREAAELSRGARALIANTTMAPARDGEVTAQDGLTLTLSQPIEGEGPFVIWLNLKDLSAEPIDCTKAGARSVTLAQAPSQALVLDPAAYAKTTYLLTPDPDDSDDVGGQAFRIASLEPDDRKLVEVQAVIDDPRVYEHDGVAFGATKAQQAFTAALIARMTNPPDVVQQESIDQVAVELAAILPKVDALYLAGHDQQSSLLSWPNASYNATAEGAVSFEPYFGFTLDPTDPSPGYVDTNLDPDAAPINYTLTSASVLLWISEFEDGDNAFAVTGGGARLTYRPYRPSTGQARHGINSVAVNADAILHPVPGLHGMSRSDGAGYTVYGQAQPGILQSQYNAIAADSLPTTDFFVGRNGPHYAAMRFPFLMIGAGLTAEEIQTLQRSIAAYFARSGVYKNT